MLNKTPIASTLAISDLSGKAEYLTFRILKKMPIFVPTPRFKSKFEEGDYDKRDPMNYQGSVWADEEFILYHLRYAEGLNEYWKSFKSHIPHDYP